MKILFFQWHSYMNKGIERGLKKLGIEYDTFFYQFTDWENDDEFLDLILKRIKEGIYRCVLSVNFAPLISEACERLQVPYIAWVYDSPLHIRDLSSLKNACTTVYFFDRDQAGQFQKEGIHALHMPLAVDTEVFRLPITEKQKREHAVDISLVGKLYQTEYQYYKSVLNPYLQGYLEGIINSQMKIYGGYLIPDLVTPDLLNKINEDYAKASKGNFKMGKRELEFMLACETTGRERYISLALLSEHFQVDLYSTEEDERLSNVRQKGYADYYTKMPLIFALSRINLNISLKTVRTGIPLRVIDAMGCGGFVLSNYQQELTEYFVPGEDCAVYESTEDLFEKARFYLSHEEERLRVAHNGFEKVKREFTFESCLSKMLCKDAR